MATIRFSGKGIVWDAERNKTLCELNNGPYTTSDEREIAVLRSGGFAEEVLSKEPLKAFVPEAPKAPAPPLSKKAVPK